MPETKVRSGQLGSTLSSKTIDNTNTINTDLTKLAIAGGTNGQVLSTNGSSSLSWVTAGGGASMQVQVDTITSSTTWIKPTWGKYFKVYICGGGAGGGSGARQATTLGRCGGGAGAGSGLMISEFTDLQITGNISVTIGAGGTGGSAITSDNTNGLIGNSGGVSSFGSLITTLSANPGNGGNTSSGQRGAGITNFIVFGNGVTGGGSNGSTSSPSPVTYQSNQQIIISGGYGGGGGAGAGASSTSTSTGGTIDFWTGVLASVPASNGGTNGGNGNDGVSFTYGYLTLGTCGGGGSYKSGQATGRGGNGGYGAGGGGGAGSDNGFASGKGGDGGSGLVIIVSEG